MLNYYSLFITTQQAVSACKAFLNVLQATLLGDLSGQELETIVSTTELQKTHGTVRTRSSTTMIHDLCIFNEIIDFVFFTS